MKTIKKHLDDRKQAIGSILEQPRHEYTTETFHKLRVEIKKLNALFDLLSFCSKKFNRKKTFKPFHKIFRQAGKVRELQVEESIVINYCDENCLLDYQKKLKSQQLQEELDFFILLNKKLIKRLDRKFKVLESFISDINKKKSESYMVKMGKKIAKPLSTKTIPPRHIHDLRKLVKTVIYNTEGLHDKEECDQDQSFSEKKALADLLGQWHDLRVIVRRFNETSDINPQEEDQLEAVISELTENSEMLFSEINLAVPREKCDEVV